MRAQLIFLTLALMSRAFDLCEEKVMEFGEEAVAEYLSVMGEEESALASRVFELETKIQTTITDNKTKKRQITQLQKAVGTHEDTITRQGVIIGTHEDTITRQGAIIGTHEDTIARQGVIIGTHETTICSLQTRLNEIVEDRNEELASTLSADVVYMLQSSFGVSRIEDLDDHFNDKAMVRIGKRLKDKRLLIGHPGKRRKFKAWTWDQLKEYVSTWLVDEKASALTFIDEVRTILGTKRPFENWE